MLSNQCFETNVITSEVIFKDENIVSYVRFLIKRNVMLTEWQEIATEFKFNSSILKLIMFAASKKVGGNKRGGAKGQNSEEVQNSSAIKIQCLIRRKLARVKVRTRAQKIWQRVFDPKFVLYFW